MHSDLPEGWARPVTPLLCLVLALAGAAGSGCVKDVSSEDRLDRETHIGPAKGSVDAAELAKVNCQDTPEGLARARNENRPEADRVVVYQGLYESLRKRITIFDEAMSRNPDLAYQDGSQELVAAREACVQQSADVRVEFERYVRELVEVPTVQEYKGGSTVTVARIDFTTLRHAIESLSPDDKEQLLNRVTGAEKKIEVHAEPRRKNR